MPRIIHATLLLVTVGFVLGLQPVSFTSANDEPQERPAEQVYQGQLIAFPGPWGFMPRAGIILVSDQELETLANDPDKGINLATSFTPRSESLRQVCERAASWPEDAHRRI